MKVIPLTLGAMETSCYIIASEMNSAAVVDPADNAKKIMAEISGNGLILKEILLTHGHFDHTGAVADLKEMTGAKVYIHEKDVCMLDNTVKNVAYLMPGFEYKPFTADVILSGGDSFEMDELIFDVMSTPGHTAGSVMYFTGNTIFSGDTIFEGSVGRTDFYSGDYMEQRKSLKRIALLREDYIIYPGHGGSTTLNQEKKFNPYLKNAMADLF